MALLQGVDGYVSQRWGIPASSVTSREPEMWAAGDKAYWQSFIGGTHYWHFHPGIDISNVAGTPIRALESGTVSWANLGSPTDPLGNIDGIRVEVAINKDTRYGFNHCQEVLVHKGEIVERGQIIALMGMTGSATGSHTHMYVSIYDGIRTWLYNPAIFMPGGYLQNDPRIKPDIPVSPKEGYQIDGDPSTMGLNRYRTLVDSNTGKTKLLTILAHKPLRSGATVGSSTVYTTPFEKPWVALGYIPVSDLPLSEQHYGNVYFGPWNFSNGDHIVYVKAVDVKAR